MIFFPLTTSRGDRRAPHRSEAKIAQMSSLLCNLGKQTARSAARKANLSVGRQVHQTLPHEVAQSAHFYSIKITEDIKKYVAEPSGARQIIQRMTRRASRMTRQQAIPEEKALYCETENNSLEFVETGSEMYHARNDFIKPWA